MYTVDSRYLEIQGITRTSTYQFCGTDDNQITTFNRMNMQFDS